MVEFKREDGGDGEIRTLEGLPLTHFPGVLLQPLGHVTLFELLRLAIMRR